MFNKMLVIDFTLDVGRDPKHPVLQLAKNLVENGPSVSFEINVPEI